MASGARRNLLGLVAVIAVAVMLTGSGQIWAQQPAGESVRLDQNAIGGVVTGTQGPEAGVWVIAETNSLPTKFVKIVVTDDRGRYAIPELPAGTYDVWVRGYGLVDSPKVQSEPGNERSEGTPTVGLRAQTAPHFFGTSVALSQARRVAVPHPR